MMSTNKGKETPGSDAEFDIFSEIEKLLDKELETR